MYVDGPGPKKQEAINLRNSGLTYEEIGKQLGVSRQRVHQLLKPQPPAHLRDKDKYRGYLNTRMKQWLKDAGYRKCGWCHLWKDAESFYGPWAACKQCTGYWARVGYQRKKGLKNGL